MFSVFGIVFWNGRGVWNLEKSEGKEKSMLVKFSNSTKRLRLHIHWKRILRFLTILFPLILVILALLFLQLTLLVWDWRRENKKEINTLSVKFPTYFITLAQDYGKQYMFSFDWSEKPENSLE